MSRRQPRYALGALATEGYIPISYSGLTVGLADNPQSTKTAIGLYDSYGVLGFSGIMKEVNLWFPMIPDK